MTLWERVSAVWALVGPLLLIGWWMEADWIVLCLLWVAGGIWTLGAAITDEE